MTLKRHLGTLKLQYFTLVSQDGVMLDPADHLYHTQAEEVKHVSCLHVLDAHAGLGDFVVLTNAALPRTHDYAA